MIGKTFVKEEKLTKLFYPHEINNLCSVKKENMTIKQGTYFPDITRFKILGVFRLYLENSRNRITILRENINYNTGKSECQQDSVIFLKLRKIRDITTDRQNVI